MQTVLTASVLRVSGILLIVKLKTVCLHEQDNPSMVLEFASLILSGGSSCWS